MCIQRVFNMELNLLQPVICFRHLDSILCLSWICDASCITQHSLGCQLGAWVRHLLLLLHALLGDTLDLPLEGMANVTTPMLVVWSIVTMQLHKAIFACSKHSCCHTWPLDVHWNGEWWPHHSMQLGEWWPQIQWDFLLSTVLHTLTDLTPKLAVTQMQIVH